MMQDLIDSEVMKLLRLLFPFVMIAILLVTALEGYFIHLNSDTSQVQEQQIQALISQNAALQAANAQSAAQFQIFLKQFNAENNYECTVLWYLNHANAAIPEAPPISVCKVTAP